MANFFLDNKDLQYHLGHPLMKKIVDLKEQGFRDKDQYDYAPVDFEDAIDSYKRVLEIVGDVTANTIAPNADSVDKEGPRVENDRVIYARGTQENHDMLTQAGVYGISLPRRFGGLNFPLVPYVMTCELVSRADAGFGNIWGLQDCAETLHEFASEEINAEFLPQINKGATAAMDLTEPDAGSDLQAVMLKATPNPDKPGEWLLNGVKRFITNGDGDISLVLARSEEGTTDARGLSLFVYDKKNMAVKVRRIEHKLGIIGSPTCELVFTNAPAKLVGDRKMGLIKYVMALMNSARLGIGAQSVGIMEAAYREALKYAHEREQFGKPIIQFPAVYELLTNMKARLQASRALLYETARFVDVYKNYFHIEKERKLTKEERDEMKKYQKLADAYTPLLKLFSSEYSNSVAYDALQIHGGSGFMKDYAIERIYRDARITTIYEGTSQLQVVAAIRGVTTGVLLGQMQGYEAIKPVAEMENQYRTLVAMRQQYEEAVKNVHELSSQDSELLDFHARRLVEMGGYIIMGHLMLQQASDPEVGENYRISAIAFIKEGEAKCNAHLTYIKGSDPDSLGYFKMVLDENVEA
ncbi:acyl-CoA dehydrogenase family protein [Millionella massiliensis]|uniref:acyl-CoA dehydrogenase family protein n=1 Tax=Millionella massiliensis TaxID=1871023 RepID=UPI0008D93A36|nr:acyl-CoA dehydrogenase family protein [Millionella massiliensis]